MYLLKLKLAQVPEGIPVVLQDLGYFLELNVGGRFPFKLGGVRFEEDSVGFSVDIPWLDNQHFYRLDIQVYKDGRVEIR
jgi:hypothetical protein